MTFDYQQMKRELAPRHQSMFGDAKKFHTKTSNPKLTVEQINELVLSGTTANFYNSDKIWGYFCVNPNDYSNYMFSHIDRENRYNRMRKGVHSLFLDGFDVYVVKSQ